ncbi:ribosome recycling factor, partial [Cutaneotrichosporon oleaginosum]
QERVLLRVRRKVERVLEWARVVVYDGVERAHGRLTPAMLDGIKLATPTGSAALRSLASVTSVPADRALRVEAFDPATAKAVFAAIRDAGIPGLSASKEEGIVRVEVARPTGTVREGLARNIHEGLESAKHQIRGARAEGLKALGGRGSEGADAVCEVTEGAVGVLDGMWVGVREELKK